MCWCFSQESSGGDDLGAAAAEVLPGVAGGETGSAECQTGGTSGEDEPAGAEQEEPTPGAGDQTQRGERRIYETWTTERLETEMYASSES